MTAMPRQSVVVPSTGILAMAFAHLTVAVTALSTASSCTGPPSVGCANGLWNEKVCRCDCIPPFCRDVDGKCRAIEDSCTGIVVAAWAECVSGVDCPWWASNLVEERCETGANVPAGTWDIYNSQQDCCNTKFPYSSTCHGIGIGILPRQLQADIVECSTDQDCFPTIRSRKPTLTPFTKVDMCECYAYSNLVPFDECEGEGDDTCPIAKCAGDACEGTSAFCDTDAGVCDLDGSSPTTNFTVADGNETVSETAPTSIIEPTKPAEVQCTQDTDCIPTIRKSIPSPDTPLIGVELCSCYVQSSLEPLFDECQGEDETKCQMTENSIISCDVMACDEKEGFCNTDGGGGVCELRELNVDDEEGDGDVDINATVIATACNTTNDCFATMRDRIPSNQDVIGVGSCECYADSVMDPFDECQGEEEATCPTASCVEDGCMMKEAVCDSELGVCILEETIPEISGIATGDDDTNATLAATAATTVNANETASIDMDNVTMTSEPTKPAEVQCTQDADCIPTIRKSIPSPDTPLDGVELCSCYVQSSLEPLFDECQGEDETKCQMTENSIISCDVMACDGLEGYCNVESGSGVCELLELEIPDEDGDDDGDINATVIAAACNTTNDCFATMRDRVPSNQDVVGVGSCGCYSDSKIDSFDECQGEEDATCATASCVEDSCMMKEAVCDSELGVCVLEETVPEISGIAAGDDEGATLTTSTVTAETVTGTFSTGGTSYSTNQPGFSEIGENIEQSDEGEVDGKVSTVTTTSTVSVGSVATITSTESPITEVVAKADDGDTMDLSAFSDISSSTMVMLGSASTMIMFGNLFLVAGFAVVGVLGFMTL